MKWNRITAHLAAMALIQPLNVYALGLGKLTVNSALGQPLSAEIELLAVDKSELDSINAGLASEQDFRDSDIEYTPVLSALQFKVDKGVGGRPVLKVTSTRPINDPFLDMLIELRWASGRLVREYTVLLDLPGTALPQVVAPLPVALPVSQTPEAVAPAVSEVPLAVAKPAAAVPSEVIQPAKPGEPAEFEEMTSEAGPVEKEAEQVTRVVRVKPGDTLTAIANRVKPANISLDQALISLFKENEHAFVDHNINRLKVGETLTIPSAETMAQVDPQTASREVRLHASDWQVYRTSLAERVAALPVNEPAEESNQVSTGKITPRVEDKAKPVEEVKDVLKLSKAAASSVATPTASGKEAETAKQASAKEATVEDINAQEEDLIARQKAIEESSERVAILEKQIQDMQSLVQMEEKAQEGAIQPPAPLPAPTIEAKPPVETPQVSLLEQIVANPMYWAGGLAALGLGGGLWWMLVHSRRRKANTFQPEDNPVSNLVPQTTSGGTVDTSDSSFLTLTDFSRVDLGKVDTQDVDPIAEAEVYMAYGRDAQAEEILKEALNKMPDRHEIRIKLLEIYAARKNTAAFETIAKGLRDALGDAQPQLWERAAELGRSIDPGNPLYGKPSGKAEAVRGVSTSGAIVTGAVAAAVAAVADEAVAEVQESTQLTPALGPTMPAREAAPGVPDFETQVPDLNALAQESRFPEINLDRKTYPDQGAAFAASTGLGFDQSLEFDLSGLDIKVPKEDTSFGSDQVVAQSVGGKLDFSGIDLNLDEVGSDDSMDEVATKLDLARAYLEMGDKEGAREILQEVLKEGNEKQQNDARSLIASL